MKKVFLRYWIIVLIEAGIIAYGAWNGTLLQIYNADHTHLTVGIFALFLWATYKIGRACYLMDNDADDAIATSDRAVEFGWFQAEMFMGYGLVGTVFGFMTMFGTMGTTLNSDPGAIFAAIAVSAAQSITPMLVGVICSIALKNQNKVLQSALSS